MMSGPNYSKKAAKLALECNANKHTYHDVGSCINASYESNHDNGKDRVCNNPSKRPANVASCNVNKRYMDSSLGSDSDFSTDYSIGMSKKERVMIEKLKADNKSEMEQNDHEILYLKAIVQQYQTKAKKVRTLAMASISREDYLLEDGNSLLERGLLEKIPL